MHYLRLYLRRTLGKDVGLCFVLGFCCYLMFFLTPPGSSWWKPTGWTLDKGVLVSLAFVFSVRLLCWLGLMFQQDRRAPKHE